MVPPTKRVYQPLQRLRLDVHADRACCVFSSVDVLPLNPSWSFETISRIGAVYENPAEYGSIHKGTPPLAAEMNAERGRLEFFNAPLFIAGFFTALNKPPGGFLPIRRHSSVSCQDGI